MPSYLEFGRLPRATKLRLDLCRNRKLYLLGLAIAADVAIKLLFVTRGQLGLIRG